MAPAASPSGAAPAISPSGAAPATSPSGAAPAATPGPQALALSDTPLLRAHRGTQPDLILLWNDISAPPEALHVVLHLHGWNEAGPRLRLAEAVRESGLGYAVRARPLDGSAPPPLLCVVPRGHWLGERIAPDGRPPEARAYAFPALLAPGAVPALIGHALRTFARARGMPADAPLPRVSRLTLTAHSGGGDAARLLLARPEFQPDAVFLFDALYAPPDAVAAWAARRIKRDAAAIAGLAPAAAEAWLRSRGGALCAAFLEPGPGAPPEAAEAAPFNAALAARLAAMLPPDAALRRRWRVLRAVPSALCRSPRCAGCHAHGCLPTVLAPLLLADPAVSLAPMALALP
ncbi:hypothetical protein M0638_01590 [Roseomonas sp. NAR14]|uniref:Uncharacterized protein n=1 Tax=Roseomonas acroporae TaxID=2937791 RepID=A0A9X2BRX7_9PROT|nr:hypothetical protein [Roseomonas acroporae]MCK8783073.1 hypothetical protein [Roseomonas acroporae]